MALILAAASLGCVRERYNLRGSVVDAAGKPVESAFVSWWNGDCGEYAGRTPNAMDVTDDEGTFELTFTGPVHLDATGLQVQKGGYLPQCIAAPEGRPAGCQGNDCPELRVVLAKD